MPMSEIGAAKYGLSDGPVTADNSGVTNGSVTNAMTTASGLAEDNVVIWIVALVAVSTGLAAFSVHGRVGKFAASASAG